MIQVGLAELLVKRVKTYYRPSKETGFPHQLFLRLLRGCTSSINFGALEPLVRHALWETGETPETFRTVI